MSKKTRQPAANWETSKHQRPFIREPHDVADVEHEQIGGKEMPRKSIWSASKAGASPGRRAMVKPVDEGYTQKLR